MERLNLAGLELLIEGAVVEVGLPSLGATKRSTMMKTRMTARMMRMMDRRCLLTLSLDRLTLSKLGEVRKIAVEFLIVQTVTYGEDVRDGEPSVIEGDVDLPARGLIEEDAGAKARRTPRSLITLEGTPA